MSAVIELNVLAPISEPLMVAVVASMAPITASASALVPALRIAPR